MSYASLPGRVPRFADGDGDVARSAALVAAVLGVAHALVSAYWALGGTVLLNTIGGDLERWGRERRPALIAAKAARTRPWCESDARLHRTTSFLRHGGEGGGHED